MDDICLIADVGGTNIRLAIASKKLQDYHLLQSYLCQDFKTIKDAIDYYLSSLPKEYYPNQAILAIAAVISSDTISMTNHNWTFSVKQLTKDLNFKSVEVINDFEAQAHAVPYLKKEDIDYVIQAKNGDSKFKNLVIAGAGTGLGTSLLFNNNSSYEVVPTECGHSMIGTYTAKEQAIFNNFTKTHQCNSYAEAFLSGKGILNIYAGLCAIEKLKVDTNLSSEMIFKNALKDFSQQKNSLYLQTMEVFCEILGTYLANLVLIFLPKEIYLTGGIIPSILPYLKNGSFKSRFFNKTLPTIQNILNNTSIYVITKKHPAMLGLCSYFINSAK